MEWIKWLFAAVVIIACLLAAWRFGVLRSKGAPIVIRRMPARGVHGWRHGTIRYTDDKLMYYKLRSLSPLADYEFARTGMMLAGKRPLTPEELEFMEPGLSVCSVKSGGEEFEFALDFRGETALTSWVESAPSLRQMRSNPKEALRHITRRRSGA